ncbi:hypothetical protein M011DRAFT_456550 [Sporormia fimetaria CBS 119925]|uniref:MARVEL domain-containing protein n=1 Tax=Sporormia fimetaria CBS 119925 TaxID=1340428 RepID=A0A6A6VKX9_9PLEO|nr:hypothetical protein M011DRAFT_456550 [Sporormia fimetaria CBS 119925]
MKINPAPFHMAQVALIGIAAALSVAILGTSAHTLDVFNKQQTINPWWMPFWPQHFDVDGTKALIGSSAATIVLSMVFLAFALVPRFALTPTMRALLGLGTTLPSCLVNLVTVIYAHILNSNGGNTERDTIQTWTCKYQNGTPFQGDVALLPNMGNENFGSLCRESRFAVYGTLIVFLLLGFSLVLTILAWAADKWAARKSSKEVEMQ